MLDVGLAFMGLLLYVSLDMDGISLVYWGSNFVGCSFASCPTAADVVAMRCISIYYCLALTQGFPGPKSDYPHHTTGFISLVYWGSNFVGCSFASCPTAADVVAVSLSYRILFLNCPEKTERSLPFELEDQFAITEGPAKENLRAKFMLGVEWGVAQRTYQENTRQNVVTSQSVMYGKFDLVCSMESREHMLDTLKVQFTIREILRGSNEKGTIYATSKIPPPRDHNQRDKHKFRLALKLYALMQFVIVDTRLK
uniref:Oligopeptide transporter 7-like n=1 Tax=Tanacetum cinerariifolium TaxID=118510 RepID=A0A6L2KYT3_TANCI|nr:oligopeptide transporter 7-like [Tanacetum cinerariifolium]